jgi:hypothetical protein
MPTLAQAIADGSRQLAQKGGFNRITGDLMYTAEVNTNDALPGTAQANGVTKSADVPSGHVRLRTKADKPADVRPCEVWVKWTPGT